LLLDAGNSGFLGAGWYTGAKAAQCAAASPRGGAFKAEGDLGHAQTSD